MRRAAAPSTKVAVIFAFGAFMLALAHALPALSQGQTAKDASTPSVREIKIGYLIQQVEKPIPISRLDVPPADEGIAGAKLGDADNNTTGRFIGQKFTLTNVTVPIGGDAVAEAKKLIESGHHFILLDAPADAIVKIADAAGQDALLFNISSTDDMLRQENCRANVIHVAPSRNMLADALAQYLVWKRWNKWLLVEGAHPADKAMGNALRRAARKFGAKIVETREYKEEESGSPRTDTGHEQIQTQMPGVTQGAADHDVVVVADESEVFGAYMPYRTFEARPVAGTAGLVASSWHPALEAFGGTQFQNRFDKLSKRPIRDKDYLAWVAVRIVGEAAQRAPQADFAGLRDYILGKKLDIAAFKGRKLTIRPWNNQLRQPIILGTAHLPVSFSPQPGFLHERDELDTLGIDEPESKCHLRK
jgi:ABC transporter substrate binding protein (PQQ-dependent alcohol dehydrogenase system)